jgi:hypothetical protein
MLTEWQWWLGGGEVAEVATSMVVSDELAGDAAIRFVMHCHTNSR